MKKISVLFLSAIILCQFSFSTFLFAQKTTGRTKSADKYSVRLRTFEDFVLRQMERDRIPGMTVGFRKDDYQWIKGFGYSDLENKVPAKPESSYQTASILKGMTAVAILQLAEQGKINLDAEVQTYVPYFPKKKFPITVRQLLAHLGGIPHYKNEWEKYNKEPKTTKETIAIFANYDLVAEPGTKFSYSTYGYDLLGAIIEEASGKPYGNYMRENVWKPLEMNETRMDNLIEFIPNRVKGYQYFDNGEKNALFGEVKNAEFIDFSTRFAAGGARTTVIDMLKFGRAMKEGKLLSHESFELTRTAPATKEGRISGFPGTGGYAMGAMLLQLNGRFCFYYSGGQNGTSTSIFNFPGENLTIAFAMNIQSNRGFAYFQRLFQLIIDEPLFSSVYTRDRTHDDQLGAMQDVFDSGLSYFDINQKQLTDNQKEMEKAFAYINKYADGEFLASDRQEALKKIGAGQQPFAGRPFTKIGSFIARRLSEKYGVQKIKSYHAQGAISFFNDYIEMYKNEIGYPKELRFGEKFEAAIRRWNDSWKKTNIKYVRGISITPETDFAAIERQLKKTFAGADVYPDLGLNAFNTGASGLNFFNTVNQLILKGDVQKAVRAGQLAVELYPESDLSNTALAIAKIVGGETSAGQLLLKKAVALNARGAASADDLNSAAYDFASAGNLNAGLALLKATIELHPNEANLYDSLGEFFLRKGEKEEAIKFYKKALELNPNFAHAKLMLEKLKARQ